MGCTVRELLARLDSAELTEWMGFAQVDPFGGLRSDLQAGVIASTIANVNRDTKKRKRPFQPGEFVLKFAPQKRTRTPDELLTKAQMITKILGHKLTQEQK